MNNENFVKNIFETFGYNVIKIKEGKSKSPDFLVSCEDEKFIVELKTKLDDPIILSNRTDTLLKGKVFLESNTAGRKNTISKIIKGAVAQLDSYREEVDFRLIWLLSSDSNQATKFEQFQSSLYGKVDIVNHEEDSLFAKPCYYFTNSDFFNYKESLDGAIVSTIQGGKLLLNDHSSRMYRLKNSMLYKKMYPAVVDPVVEEQNNEAYIITTDIDRSDEKKVLNYVKNKYNQKKLQNITWQHQSGEILSKK